MPSIADMLYEKGFKQGREIGRREGRKEERKLLINSIFKLLKIKFKEVPELFCTKFMEVHNQSDLESVIDYAVSSETWQQFEEQVKPLLKR